jgi:predicted acetyltransferase
MKRPTAHVPDEATRLALQAMLGDAYNIPTERWGPWLTRLGSDNLRVWTEDGRVLAGLGVYPFGQLFGGRSVALGGIAGVGVAAEARGRGLARTAVVETLEELRAHGTPLAGLFASTTTLYRRCGFEQAGARLTYRAPVASLPPGDRTPACTRIPPDQHARLHPLYARRAATWSGHLDRNAAMWERLVQPAGATCFIYLLGPSDAPEGYVVFTQRSNDALHFDVLLAEAVLLTRAAAQRMLALMFDLRSLACDLVWTSCTSDPLVGMLPEATAKVQTYERWMLRIVDVDGALLARGWPPIRASVDLDVADDALPANQGRRVLRVEDGVASVEAGGRGEARLDVRGLAALYSGFASPHALVAQGLATGPDDAMAALGAMFAGPEPWCCDHY